MSKVRQIASAFPDAPIDYSRIPIETDAPMPKQQMRGSRFEPLINRGIKVGQSVKLPKEEALALVRFLMRRGYKVAKCTLGPMQMRVQIVKLPETTERDAT